MIRLPFRTIPRFPEPAADTARPEQFHFARLLVGPREVMKLRDALSAAGQACDSSDAELFTGPDAFTTEPEPDRLAREEQAKAICAGCPARPECLAYALAVRPETGVWAGLTATEIRARSRRSATSSGGEEAA